MRGLKKLIAIIRRAEAVPKNMVMAVSWLKLGLHELERYEDYWLEAGGRLLVLLQLLGVHADRVAESRGEVVLPPGQRGGCHGLAENRGLLVCLRLQLRHAHRLV